MTSFMALILLFLLVFVVFHFYARFDKFAEEHNEGTPLKTTIPTLLMIAFAYEIFPPLSHFSILLPMALIATALARDLMLWFEPQKEHILKGELESAMLDELHREHLGEHDHTGRRVPDEQEQTPPSTQTPKRKARASKSDQPDESGGKPDSAPAEKESSANGGSEA
ncbi:hypothetical protein [Methyloceanibacter caenitepidi]|uniref:Uncharacterized protein n=1 Tax=Methyloceanibacter caenitepidi TaxID=1384459 RepID=A0A0A8K3D4_9HYPH|nr:hypothetical protein [Methyloceanibacter caenitepidi]BAQ17306.1 hypothetical protein GL4_1854 [Methyloceanibacter caenitepidi]